MQVRHRPLLAWGTFGLTCVLVGAGGWLSAGAGPGRTQPADAVLALAFTAAGALIVSRRSNPLGWLALLMGLSGLAYAADSYAAWAMAHRAAGVAWSGWLGLWVWAPAWLALLTVLPLLIPDGRLPSPRWRPLLIATWSVIALFTVTSAFLPASGDGGPANPLAVPGLAGPARHGETVMVALLLVLALGCLSAVVTRLRRSSGQVRRQLVWICTGAVIGIAAGFGGAVLPAGWVTPVQSAGALAMPSCLGVAVLRHNLYQVDPVLRRSLTYGLLGCALSLTALGVTTLGAIVLGRDRPVITVLAAVIIALLVNPAYRLISGGVSRLLYGARGDPYAALSALGRRLADTTDPRQVLEALAWAAAETVRSPYVVVETVKDLLRVERGTPCPIAVSIPLAFQGATLGWLRLAPRSPGETFDPHDRRLLEDASAHAAAAVCAAVTELDLRAARARLVTTREEERRQLRRDLHDGVGPLLAGLSFTAAAAAGALPEDPARAAQLLSSVHQQAVLATTAVRQVSRRLRPATLTELGLGDAIRLLTEPAVAAGMEVRICLPADLPALPAATEVAAYHIAAEALSNALRHSRATRLSVELSRAQGQLVLRIADDGTGVCAPPRDGVGLTSMRQRAEEVRGVWSLTSADGTGTVVETRLPLLEATLPEATLPEATLPEATLPEATLPEAT